MAGFLWFKRRLAGVPLKRRRQPWLLYARQNGFSASRAMSLHDSPTSCRSRSFHCASSDRWRWRSRPDMQRFAELGQKPRIHDDLSSFGVSKWTSKSPKANLLRRISALIRRFRQTTLCTASDDIKSCIGEYPDDRSTAVAEWIARVRGRRPASELYGRGVRTERHPDRDQPSDPAARGGTWGFACSSGGTAPWR